MFRKVLFFVFLLILPVENKKFGGSSGRGGSAARQGSGSGGHQQPNYQSGSSYAKQNYPSQTGGYRPPTQGGYGQGGYHQPNVGYQQPRYPAQQTGFHQGTGPGSASRGSQWKTALAAGAVGAVGGVLAYEAGKAIIKSATQPAQIGGRNYYFNNDEHRYQSKPNELTCSMPLGTLINQTRPATTAAPASENSSNGTEATTAPGATTTPSPDKLLSSMQFQDGSRPKTVTWTCRLGAEVCCGTECCPAPPQQNGSPPQEAGYNSYVGFTIVFIVLLILLSCCIMLCKFVPTVLDKCCSIFKDGHGSPYNDDLKYPDNQPQGYATYQSQPLQQETSVPMHSYPGAHQPQTQGGYPPAVGYVYPSQPAPY